MVLPVFVSAFYNHLPTGGFALKPRAAKTAFGLCRTKIILRQNKPAPIPKQFGLWLPMLILRLLKFGLWPSKRAPILHLFAEWLQKFGPGQTKALFQPKNIQKLIF